MIKLRATYKGITFYEKEEIIIDKQRVTVFHITVDGFLYNRQCNIEDEYITVTNSKEVVTYYSDWDYLKFIACDVDVIQAN